MRVVCFVPGHSPDAKYYKKYCEVAKEQVVKLGSIFPEPEIWVHEEVLASFGEKVTKAIGGKTTGEETRELIKQIEGDVVLILIDAPQRLPRRLKETTKIIAENNGLLLAAPTRSIEGWSLPVVIEDPHRLSEYPERRKFFQLIERISEKFFTASRLEKRKINEYLERVL